MDDYVAKPIHAQQLYEVIHAVTGRVRNDDATTGGAGMIPAAGENSNPLDLETALARLGGDEELLKQAAALFLDESDFLLASIRAAVANQDPESVELASHTLKGSMANFGATPACDLAFKLEIMGRERNLVGDTAVMTALEAEVERVTSAVADLLGKQPEETVCLA
jgi:HPt (histidine-containing phosphotransfer) domain-containing protein